MRSILPPLICFAVYSLHSCEKNADPVIPTNSFYFTSFESLSESSWNRYSSEDTLHCLQGDTLHLELISGGLLASAMRIDQIEISEVE